MADLALQLLLNGIIIGSMFALGGVSWGIIYNTTSTFHYAACFIFSAAGYAAILVGMDAQLHLCFSFIAAVLTSALMGVGIELWIYRPLRKNGAKLFNIFLASMGIATIGLVLILLVFSSNPRVLSGFPMKVFSFGPVTFTSVDMLTVISCWLLIGLLLIFMVKNKYGKIIRAVGINPDMAEIYGLDVNKIFLIVYAIGSGLFGAEAFLFALKYTATPFMGLSPFFIAFTAVFLGGEGTILGAAIGGLFLGVAMQLGMLFLPGTYTILVAFSILFVLLLIKPKGLLGAKNIV